MVIFLDQHTKIIRSIDQRNQNPRRKAMKDLILQAVPIKLRFDRRIRSLRTFKNHQHQRIFLDNQHNHQSMRLNERQLHRRHHHHKQRHLHRRSHIGKIRKNIMVSILEYSFPNDLLFLDEDYQTGPPPAYYSSNYYENHMPHKRRSISVGIYSFLIHKYPSLVDSH